MYQAFMVVLREGVEAFLIVAITCAYLRKIGQGSLLQAVFAGIVISVLASTGLGYFLWVNQGANQPLWEGIFALVTVILVGSLLVHMWKTGPQLKKTMETRLSKLTAPLELKTSYLGIFLFTLLMITREGMEMALLLFQLRENAQMVTGIILGVLGAAGIALLWQQFGYLINWNRFFQITTIFLGLFLIQIAMQGFHEFTEAGIFPNSEALHSASEPFSTEGIYGKWYTNFIFFGSGFCLLASLLLEGKSKEKIKAV